jgi:hypothetical protein
MGALIQGTGRLTVGLNIRLRLRLRLRLRVSSVVRELPFREDLSTEAEE